MTPILIFATNNTHKIEEIQAAVGQDLHVITLREAGIDIDIPEPHDTLEANALEKSSAIHRLTGETASAKTAGWKSSPWTANRVSTAPTMPAANAAPNKILTS